MSWRSARLALGLLLALAAVRAEAACGLADPSSNHYPFTADCPLPTAALNAALNERLLTPNLPAATLLGWGGSGLTAPTSTAATAFLNPATNSLLGVVRPDTTTITQSAGVLSAVSGAAGINQLTGDVTAGAGVGSQAATLATSGVSAGTYTKITVDAKGRATVGATAAASDLSNGTTGSGAIVLATSPSLTTPTLGVAAATSINKVALTAPATGATLTIADGKTLTDTSAVGAVLLKGATSGGFAAAAAADIPATTLAAGTSVSLSAPRQYYVCTGTCTVTPPVPVAGYEFCVLNDNNVSTVITLAALGSSARYENTARTAYGTAGTGTFISGGAVGDKVCIVGRDSTHYLTPTFQGTWTAS